VCLAIRSPADRQHLKVSLGRRGNAGKTEPWPAVTRSLAWVPGRIGASRNAEPQAARIQKVRDRGGEGIPALLAGERVQNAAIEHYVGTGQARSICQYVGNDKVNADIREPSTLGGKTHSLRRDVAGADIVSVLCQPDAVGSQSAPDLQDRGADRHLFAEQAGHHRRDGVVLPGRIAATESLVPVERVLHRLPVNHTTRHTATTEMEETETGFSVVLFDRQGTLFHDERDEVLSRIRASVTSIGQALDDADVMRLASQLGNAAEHPQVLAARERADCFAELHPAATLLELRLAGFGDELALAIWSRDGDVAATHRYPDTPQVLRALRSRGVRIGVISDIHYDVQPHFERHGLAECIDTFTLSCQHGCEKPDPRLFQIALQVLGTRPLRPSWLAIGPVEMAARFASALPR
jgi:FMN phosphatase YigB (HAD superfamily)